MVTKMSDAAPPKRGRPRQFDEAEVLDRAVDLLWREGPAALSLNDLAARLGLAKPALARTFGGKDDLLAAVLRRYRDRVDGPVLAEVAEAATVGGVARAYLMGYAGRLARKPAGPATGCLLAATTETTALSEGPVARTARDLNALNRAALEEALREVGATEPEALATFLYGQSVALAFLSRGGADTVTLTAFAERGIAAVEVAP